MRSACVLLASIAILLGGSWRGPAEEQTKYPFILVHGSWHDGRAWDQVKQELEIRGHDVYAPTLLGNGAGAKKDIMLSETVDAVVSDIKQNDREDFVLVGHSFGGSITSQIADRMPDRAHRLVF